MVKTAGNDIDDDKQSDEGSAGASAEPRFLIIGRIVRPHGVRGEVRASILTELPERFEWLEHVYIARDAEDRQPLSIAVEAVRFHQKNVLLKLGGYDSRDAADVLRLYWLLIPEDEHIPLEEGEYFYFQLENMAVYTEAGEYLGRIVEILETKANDVFVVRDENRELLLPDIDDVVKEIDPDARKIIVHILPGLIP